MRIPNIFRRSSASSRSVHAESNRKKPDEGASGAPETKMQGPGWYWTQHPMVRDRVNTFISGDRDIDAYGRLAQLLDEDGYARPLGKCISLGCGFGGLERGLALHGMIGEIDAYDLSEGAIAEARRLAAEQGLSAIRYHVADPAIEALTKAEYDAAFTHGSLHHVEALEKLFAAVHRSLKAGGIFHLVEFVGPNHFQWTDNQISLINEYLETLPERLLQSPNGRKKLLERPTFQQMLPGTSQAARSAEIRSVLSQMFDIVEERPFGGALLHMGLSEIAQNFEMTNPDDVADLLRFFDLEDRMMDEGVIHSDFTVLTALPASEPRCASLQNVGEARPRPGPVAVRPMRRLRPPPGFNIPGLDLTVSRADTMLGTSDAHYLSVGQSALGIIERSLGDTKPLSILDLPCGFGRVTRALRARFPNAAITVSDLDTDGVDFSASQFNARAAYSVRDFSKLDLGEAYDLIWVGSLMTHLPSAQTKLMLAALTRHMTSGATLVVTLHGPSIVPRLRETGYGLPPGAAEEVIKEFEQTGFGYRDYVGGESLYGISLSNDHYGISLTAEPWMCRALEECGLRLHAYEVRAWDDHHDIVVARRA